MALTIIDAQDSFENGLKILGNFNLPEVQTITLCRKNYFKRENGRPVSMTITCSNAFQITIVNSFGMGLTGQTAEATIKAVVKLGIPLKEAQKIYTCHTKRLTFNLIKKKKRLKLS